MENIQNINIDIMNNKIYEYIYAKQWDEGRIVVFNVTDDNQSVNVGNFVMFEMKKPDGHVVLYSCPIEDGKAKVILSMQMTACAGKIPYQLNIYSEAQPVPNPGDPVDPTAQSGDLISTVTGYMIVEESVVQPEDVESSDEFNVVSDMAQTLGEVADILANDGAAIIQAAQDSFEYSEISKSYAVGGTDYQHDGQPDTYDNSKYYCEQTKQVYNTAYFAKTITLEVSEWDNQTNTQDVVATGVIDDDQQQFIMVRPVEESLVEYHDCNVMCVHQGDDYLTFHCDTIPQNDLDVYIMVQTTNAFDGVNTSNIIYRQTEPEPNQNRQGDFWVCSYE